MRDQLCCISVNFLVEICVLGLDWNWKSQRYFSPGWMSPCNQAVNILKRRLKRRKGEVFGGRGEGLIKMECPFLFSAPSLPAWQRSHYFQRLKEIKNSGPEAMANYWRRQSKKQTSKLLYNICTLCHFCIITNWNCLKNSSEFSIFVL